MVAKQLCRFEDLAFPSTNGRGLKINLSKAKVRFSGEGSDLSDSVKSLVSTVEKTAGLPRSQGYLLPRNDMARKAAFTLAEGATPIKCHAELVSASNQCDSLGSAYSESRNDVKMARSRNSFAYRLTHPHFVAVVRFVKFGMTSKKAAFTLAEVLITLGIIGVVAAMTLPALIQNYQKSVYLNQLKKTYAVLNTAVQGLKVEYGEVDPSQMPLMLESGHIDIDKFGPALAQQLKVQWHAPDSENKFCFDDATKWNYKVLNGAVLTSNDFNLGTYAWQLNDGACVVLYRGHFPYRPWTNDSDTKFIIDVNGSNKGPNVYGKDTFVFLFKPDGRIIPPYLDRNRDELKARCTRPQAAWYEACSTLIVQDGWQMAKDYPW